MTVLVLSELGPRRDERAQEEFELGALTSRRPRCFRDDSEGIRSLRRCRRCATWWNPEKDWARSLCLVLDSILVIA